MAKINPGLNFFGRYMSALSNDVGIDLGTANTLVYVKGRGIVINEPSIVAVNQKTGQVVAIGSEAREMLGRTPSHIIAVSPLTEGVISDFEIAEEMIAYLLRKAQGGKTKLFGPRTLVGVPSGITNVEVRAVRDAAYNAGAREVHIMEEPMAAAIGMRLPIHDPSGCMVVDIGGGTTDIGIISLGGMVTSKNVRVAGDHFNADILGYIRNECKILVGERSVEDVKISAGSVIKGEQPITVLVRGRDLVSGLPREVVLTDNDVRNAIAHSVEELIEAIKEVLEMTPPEILGDIMQKGMYLAGGGALIKGLPELISEALQVPVHVADDPLTCVARGTGLVLDDLEAYQDALLFADDEILSP